jgi:hypothetical protein
MVYDTYCPSHVTIRCFAPLKHPPDQDRSRASCKAIILFGPYRRIIPATNPARVQACLFAGAVCTNSVSFGDMITGTRSVLRMVWLLILRVPTCVYVVSS